MIGCIYLKAHTHTQNNQLFQITGKNKLCKTIKSAERLISKHF